MLASISRRSNDISNWPVCEVRMNHFRPNQKQQQQQNHQQQQ